MAKQISERVSYTEDQDELTIVITGQIERWQEGLVVIWLIAWSVCGIYVFTQLFGDYPRESKLGFMVYVAFWGYFEYKLVRTTLWRLWGRELIKIDSDGIMIKNDVSSYGKSTRYILENVSSFSLCEKVERSFSGVYSKSFWVLGGETLGFEYFGKQVAFGRQLEKKEAETLFHLLHKRIKRML